MQPKWQNSQRIGIFRENKENQLRPTSYCVRSDIILQAQLPYQVGSHFCTESFVLPSPVIVTPVSQITEEIIYQQVPLPKITQFSVELKRNFKLQ